MKIPGSLSFFKNLYDSYYLELVGFAEAILFDRDEAEDVVQEVFCYLWDNRRSVYISSNLKSYLFTSVKNRSLNRIKRVKLLDQHSDRIKEAYLFSLNIDPSTDEKRLQRIYKLSESFPEKMGRVFFLRIREGKRYEEIADEMGISINSVKTHLKRAFNILRKSLLVLIQVF